MADETGALVAALGRLAAALRAAEPVPYGASGCAAELRGLRDMSALSRLDGVLALLAAGTAATTAAAVARGLVDLAVQRVWEDAEPAAAATAAAASLGQERRRLASVIGEHDLVVPNLDRWLRPQRSGRCASALPPPGLPEPQKAMNARPGVVAGILSMPAAVADFLALAGHANAAAGWCTVAEPPYAVGFEATPVYTAVLAQAAGLAAVVATGLGGDTAVAGAVTGIIEAAQPVHGLPAVPPTGFVSGEIPGSADLSETAPVCHLEPTPAHARLLARVLDKAAEFEAVLRHGPTPYGPSKVVNLRAALPYLTALGTAEAGLASARGELPPEIAAVGGRMLLEEAGRTWWFGDAYGDDDELRRRYVAIADEETARRARLRKRLSGHGGVARPAVAALLDPLPSERVPSLDTRRTAKGQTPPVVPSPTALMREFSRDHAEPGWTVLAYGLLSQITHATPLGLIHCCDDEDGTGRRLSPEMTALAVDAVCLGAAATLPSSAAVFSLAGGLDDVTAWTRELRMAAAAVHDAARPVHFLD